MKELVIRTLEARFRDDIRQSNGDQSNRHQQSDLKSHNETAT